MDRVEALRYFSTTNRERIRRLVELAPPGQSLFIQLLPLIFHTHSKGLPAFISNDVPIGIVDYRPEQDSLERAKQVDISFSYKQKALRHYPIRGLYLLNPHGLLDSIKSANFTLWLVIQESLSNEERQSLQQKLNAVQVWADSLNITLDTRLLTEAELPTEVLSSDERDNFYSSGLILAGSVPYWWLIPPETEQDYQQALAELKSHRLLSHATFIDFGAVTELSTQYRFKSTYHAALACINSGMEKALDLLYWQVCLSLEQQPLLSDLSKKQTYQRQNNLLGDLNLLKLSTIESLGEPQQIDFARQTFYFQSREKLSKSVQMPPHPWRRDFMYEKVAQWQWNEQFIAELDQLNQDYQQAQALFSKMGGLFNHFLLLLTHFANLHDLKVKKELQQLKLLSQLRYRSENDAISNLPLSLRPQTLNERLYLYRFKDSNYWSLSQIPLENSQQQTLFQHPNLIHTLAWAVTNQLLKSSDWLSVTDQKSVITTSAAVEIAQQLVRSGLAQDDLQLDASTTHSSTIDSLQLFINSEEQPNTKLMQQGFHLSSRQNDPLCYSSFKHNLVISLIGILRDTNGQWHSFAFHDEHAVVDFLTYILSWQTTEQIAQQSFFHCHTPTFAQAIMQRMQQLLSDCWQHLKLYPNQSKVILNVASHRYEILLHKKHGSYIKHATGHDLWWVLSQNKEKWIPTLLDRYIDTDGLLTILMNYQAPHNLNVFIYTEQKTTICYILDEAGNLIRHHYQHLNESTLLSHLQRFLGDLKVSNQIKQLRFYRLTRLQQKWFLTPVTAPTGNKAYLPVSVTMSAPVDSATVEVQCGLKSFSGKANEPTLFQQIRDLVMNLRNQLQHYPLYLDTLRFKSDRYVPTMTYLQYKQQLESALNQDADN